MRTPSNSVLSWATEQFGQAALGDTRRTQRLVHSAACLLEHPSGTLPAKFQHPADLEGFYRRMSSPAVRHAVLIRTAAARTAQRMREQPGVVLVLHDDSVLEYSRRKAIADLGQIGDGVAGGSTRTTVWP